MEKKINGSTESEAKKPTDGNQEIVRKFEEKVRTDLMSFLQKKGAVDEHVPVCPDVEEKWAEIGRAYLPDGVREFKDYPVVSLGWMMFVGMAMAYYWDTDWAKYSSDPDIYKNLRDKNGYDRLDETVVNELLGYKDEGAEKVTELVAETASRVYGILQHERIEPGTDVAFGCYVAALHQLYLAGMAMELNALGYHMSALSN